MNNSICKVNTLSIFTDGRTLVKKCSEREFTIHFTQGIQCLEISLIWKEICHNRNLNFKVNFNDDLVIATMSIELYNSNDKTIGTEIAKISKDSDSISVCAEDGEYTKANIIIAIHDSKEEKLFATFTIT